MGNSYVSCFFDSRCIFWIWSYKSGFYGLDRWVTPVIWPGSPTKSGWARVVEFDLNQTCQRPGRWHGHVWQGGMVIWVLFCTCKMHFLLLKDHFQSSARNLLSQIVTGCSVTKTRSSATAEEPRKMRHVSWNLANCHATVQKLLVRQVLNQISAVANWPVRQNRAVNSAWWSVR